MTAQEIVETIMTQHWDMAACNCWICQAGRIAGYGARNEHLKTCRLVGNVSVDGGWADGVSRPKPNPDDTRGKVMKAILQLQQERDRAVNAVRWVEQYLCLTHQEWEQIKQALTAKDASQPVAELRATGRR